MDGGHRPLHVSANKNKFGEKDRDGPGKTRKEGEAYRRNAGIVMKLWGIVVDDLGGLDIELPLSPSLFARAVHETKSGEKADKASGAR